MRKVFFSIVVPIFLLLIFSLWHTALAKDNSSDIPDISEFFLEEKYEIALGRSAAHRDVSSKATILVLKQTGYEAVIEGTNGLVCYVVRSWGRPSYFEDNEVNYRPAYLVPECLDPNGVAIILPMQLFRTRLALAGTPAKEINRATREAFETGQIQRVKTVSFSYMMSNETRYNKAFKGIPHIMVYLPDDYNNMAIGVETARGPNGFFIEGGPDQPYTSAVIYRAEYGVDIENNDGLDQPK